MTGPATRSMTIPSLGWTVLGDFLRVIKPLVIFELLFKLAATGLGMLVALVVLELLSRSVGSAAVTNTEIVDFLLSPVGVLVVAVLGLSALLVTVLEHLGVMAIVARFERGQEVTVRGIAGALTFLVPRLLKLKLAGLFWLVLMASPLAVLAGLTYAALLTRHDINYYLAEPSPELPRRGRHRRNPRGNLAGDAGARDMSARSSRSRSSSTRTYPPDRQSGRACGGRKGRSVGWGPSCSAGRSSG